MRQNQPAFFDTFAHERGHILHDPLAQVAHQIIGQLAESKTLGKAQANIMHAWVTRETEGIAQSFASMAGRINQRIGYLESALRRREDTVRHLQNEVEQLRKALENKGEAFTELREAYEEQSDKVIKQAEQLAEARMAWKECAGYVGKGPHYHAWLDREGIECIEKAIGITKCTRSRKGAKLQV
jgi:DNA repair exonuclease SbcCD ATPase subunit